MEEENNNIELRSDEVQEILGHIPSKIIRHGITVIISVVLTLFLGSFFFKYPDILIAPVEVVTENPPVAIMANTSGNLAFIYVVDSQHVQVNQKLAVIKNPAQLNHIECLKNLLKQSANMPINFSAQWINQFPDSLILGDIQSTYSSFLKAGTDYIQFVKLNYFPRKVLSLKQKELELKKYAVLMQRQADLKQQDFVLAQNQFLRDSGLYVKDVISLADYERSKKELLQNSLAVSNALSVVVNTRIQLQDLVQQITDFESDEIRQKQMHQNTLSELFHNLESRLAWWYNTYVLVSPINGVVAFNKVWSNNQYVKAGDEVFTVLPLFRTNIIGRITLAAQGAGKVKPQQAVNLKFDNYPYQEFGMITAYVSSISMVPSEQNYMVEVSLADTLITNYGYLLPFSQKMLGTAEIITDDLPLIVRLFNPLKAIMKKHWSSHAVQKK